MATEIADRENPSRQMVVNADGSINVVSGLISSGYDYISVAYPDTLTEVYTFKTGGASGTIVATITIVYTTATKDVLSTVTRT